MKRIVLQVLRGDVKGKLLVILPGVLLREIREIDGAKILQTFPLTVFQPQPAMVVQFSGVALAELDVKEPIRIPGGGDGKAGGWFRQSFARPEHRHGV